MERGLRLFRQAIDKAHHQPSARPMILSLVWLGRIEEAGAAAEAKLRASERATAAESDSSST
jgi:hypothetical protein